MNRVAHADLAGNANMKRSLRQLVSQRNVHEKARKLVTVEEQLGYLVVFFTVLVVYVSVWAAIFKAVNPLEAVAVRGEDGTTISIKETTYLDGFYFTIVTFTTVGLGDITPITRNGRILVTFFIWFSIVFAAIFVDMSNFVFKVNHQEEEDIDGVYDAERDTFFANSWLRKYLTPAHWRLVLATLLILVNLAIGIIWLNQVESFNAVDSFYIATTVLTTVGYGDITPTTRSWKLFAVFWISSGTFSLFRGIHAVMVVALAQSKSQWRELMRSRRRKLRMALKDELANAGVVGGLVADEPSLEVDSSSKRAAAAQKRHPSLTFEEARFDELDEQNTEQEWMLYELQRNGRVTADELNQMQRAYEEFTQR